MSDVVAQARRAAEKAKVAERAGLIAPHPDPLVPVLEAGHHVPMTESLAERLRGLPVDVLGALALFVTHVWWNGYRAKTARGRR